MTDKVAHTIAITALAVLGSLALALQGCGGAGGSMKSAAQTTPTRSSALVADTLTLRTAHALRGLRGDEDDDDQESPTWEKVSRFDADVDRDDDARDSAGKGYYDGDDAATRDFGRPATAAEASALTSLARRYLQAAATENGTAACSLMSAGAKALASQYGAAGGPAYLSGAGGCAGVMSRLLAHGHDEFTGAVDVVAARVSGAQADLLLGSSTRPARFMSLRRVGGAWEVDALILEPLP